MTSRLSFENEVPPSMQVPGAPEPQATTLADVCEQAFGAIDSGRVLDVATAEGGFTGVLKKHLKGFNDVFGVDIDAGVLETGSASDELEPVHVIQMDAERLAFGDDAFDTVSISFSFHHLPNVPLVLTEMPRVLKLGGHMIIVEMHQNGLSEAQLGVVHFHHWVADVDSDLGLFHQRTLPRQEILDTVEPQSYWDVECHDWSASDVDPLNKTVINPA